MGSGGEVDYTVTVNEDRLRTTVRKLEREATFAKRCPDAGGRVKGDYEFRDLLVETRDAMGRRATQSTDVQVTATFEGHVDDDAKLVDYDVEGEFLIEVKGRVEVAGTGKLMMHVPTRVIRGRFSARGAQWGNASVVGPKGSDKRRHRLGALLQGSLARRSKDLECPGPRGAVLARDREQRDRGDRRKLRQADLLARPPANRARATRCPWRRGSCPRWMARRSPPSTSSPTSPNSAPRGPLIRARPPAPPERRRSSSTRRRTPRTRLVGHPRGAGDVETRHRHRAPRGRTAPTSPSRIRRHHQRRLPDELRIGDRHRGLGDNGRPLRA